MKPLCPHIQALVDLVLKSQLEVHAKATADDGIKVMCRDRACVKKFRGPYAGCPQDGTVFLMPPHTERCGSKESETCLGCRRDA